MSAITIRATLAARPSADANVRGQGRLHVCLQVDGCRNGVRGTLYYTGLDAEGLARRDAQRMQQGDAVTVYCAGLGDDIAEPAGALRLFGLDHIEHHPAAESA